MPAARLFDVDSEMATFPLNAWYACACKSVELKHEKTPRAPCAIRSWSLYLKARRRAGDPAENTCWHRLLPLSKGSSERRRESIRLPGLVYNAEGRCTIMPSRETIQSVDLLCAAVMWSRRHGFIWVWPGERRRRSADPGARCRHALERRPGLGRRRQDDPRRLRLPAGGRQPDGLDARNLRAWLNSIGPGGRSPSALATHGDRGTATMRWMEEDIKAPPFWARQIRTGLFRAASTAGRSSWPGAARDQHRRRRGRGGQRGGAWR